MFGSEPLSHVTFYNINIGIIDDSLLILGHNKKVKYFPLTTAFLQTLTKNCWREISLLEYFCKVHLIKNSRIKHFHKYWIIFKRSYQRNTNVRSGTNRPWKFLKTASYDRLRTAFEFCRDFFFHLCNRILFDYDSLVHQLTIINVNKTVPNVFFIFFGKPKVRPGVKSSWFSKMIIRGTAKLMNIFDQNVNILWFCWENNHMHCVCFNFMQIS